jgi:hypothetical protein
MCEIPIAHHFFAILAEFPNARSTAASMTRHANRELDVTGDSEHSSTRKILPLATSDAAATRPATRSQCVPGRLASALDRIGNADARSDVNTVCRSAA